jgi:SAM-dependent methyltransferase
MLPQTATPRDPVVNEHWKEHFEHDIAFHRKTAAIYDHVNTEPRILANDLLFAPLDRLVSPGESMLDLGCGTGQMLRRYASRFRRAIGVDHSRDMLDIAEQRMADAARGRWTLVHSDFFRYLEAHAERHSLVTCVGCLHHLPVEAFDVFFRLVRSRLEANGQLLLAEPVATEGGEAPAAIARWNAKSVMAERAPLMPMEESHEAPIVADVLLRQPEAHGFRLVVASRAWEMFQRALPASALDHVAMRYLHARYGKTGNVVAALWEAR